LTKFGVLNAKIKWLHFPITKEISWRRSHPRAASASAVEPEEDKSYKDKTNHAARHSNSSYGARGETVIFNVVVTVGACA
jgi:hypothetical protein